MTTKPAIANFGVQGKLRFCILAAKHTEEATTLEKTSVTDSNLVVLMRLEFEIFRLNNN